LRLAGSTAQTEQAVPWSAGTEAPKLKVPPNACDCHMHIYDSRFPVAPNAKLRPPDATVDAYRLFQKRIGTTRNVVVTPSTYGTDNSCTLSEALYPAILNIREDGALKGLRKSLRGGERT
jgi:D-galactarolactone isomerase